MKQMEQTENNKRATTDKDGETYPLSRRSRRSHRALQALHNNE